MDAVQRLDVGGLFSVFFSQKIPLRHAFSFVGEPINPHVKCILRVGKWLKV